MKNRSFIIRFVSCLVIYSILVLFTFPALSYAQSQQEEWNKAVILFDDGQKRFNVSDFSGAVRQWEAALVILMKLENKKAIGLTTGSLGTAYSILGNYSKAINCYEHALTIANEIGDIQSKGVHLGRIGFTYSAMGNYSKAISYYQRALEIANEMGDQKGKGHLLASLGLANSNLGEYRKAIGYFEKSLVIANEMGEKGIASENLGNLGQAYSNLGDYSKAFNCYEQALAIATEIGYEKGKVTLLGDIGNICNDIGEYRLAFDIYGQALQSANKIGDQKSKGNILGNMGNVYENLGDYRNAVSFYEQSLDIVNKIGDRKGKAIRLGNLGNVYSKLGDYRKGIDFYEQALTIENDIRYKKGKGITLGNIGVAYSSQGDYLKAIQFYEQAIILCKEIDVPYDIHEGNIADAYLALSLDDKAFAIYSKQKHPVRLGRYYLKMKDYSSAKEQFNRDRKENEKAKKVGLIIPQWIGLGISHEGLKEYDRAYGWFTKTIGFMEDQRATMPPAERVHYFEGDEFGFPRIEAYEGAVRCAFMLGKYDEAFYWAENTRGRVLSELLSRRHAGEDFKITSALAREEEDLTTLIMTNKKQQQTAFEKNNPELLKQTENEYPALKQKMENLIDRLRRDYPQYAAMKYPQPVKLSQLALKQGETIIEYEVTDPYTIGLVIRDGKVIKAFKVDKTRTELSTLVSKYRSPFQEGANIKSFGLNLATELTNLLLKPAMSVLTKGEHLIIIPDESLSLLPFEALLLAAPAKALQEEATLLAQAAKQTDSGTIDKATIIRGLTQKPATRSSGVNVVPRVTTHILFDTDSAQIKKESQKQLQEMTAALQSKELKNATIQIEGHTDSIGNPKYNMKLSLKRAQAIYDYLAKNGIPSNRLTFTGKGDTEPVTDNQDEKGRRQNRRVDFVRIDGFGAQQTSSSSSQIKDFVYAMDEYPISYYQSASVLSLQRGLRISRTKEQTFFGLGDPIFDIKDNRASDKRAVKILGKKTGISSKDIADNEETKDAGYRFSRLVNTEKEVKEVGKLFGKSQMMLGVEANEEKLKAADLTSKKYVLFSTHGILGNEIPYIKQPSLVLSLVGNGKEDGFLTASEIFNLNLNADIVGLSACKTGLGVQSAGEGVVGLTRAFMYAGTDTVLVSLWSVSDESTYKLMVKFFEGLKNGKDKMTSLKDAKNYLRVSGYENPFYWAPFILVGEAN